MGGARKTTGTWRPREPSDSGEMAWVGNTEEARGPGAKVSGPGGGRGEGGDGGNLEGGEKGRDEDEGEEEERERRWFRWARAFLTGGPGRERGSWVSGFARELNWDLQAPTKVNLSSLDSSENALLENPLVSSEMLHTGGMICLH